MTISESMCRAFFPGRKLCVYGFLLSMTCQSAPAQEQAKVVGVLADSVVRVRMEIRASEKAMIIPYCGQDEDGAYWLCTGVARLQVGGVVQHLNGVVRF
jgi:hypothetical protein